MSDTISMMGLPEATTEETVDVALFDPPMCCPTGLCGPSLDQTLLNVNEMIMSLQAEGMRGVG
ncbi:MAG: arsenic metallochaperone ArsD family protein [Chloroflexota bacterium]